jgi:2-dehydropantoate 2-reductase
MSGKKICVVGLGGVGGYVGCMLAHHLNNVYFFARGERLESIKKNGLNLISPTYGEITAYPEMASNNAEELGVMDYIFISVKQFSLQQVCTEISPMIDKHTVIIPLINGVGVGDKIRSFISKGIVLDSLVYITSGSDKDFVIRTDSSYCNVPIGFKKDNDHDEKILLDVQSMLESGKIRCTIEKDIEAAIWRKYILNCAYNVVTAYYSATTGEIRKNETAIAQVKSLLEEACSVARALKVNISKDLEEEHFNHIMLKQSDSATSSLNRDITAGRQTELEVFSGRLLQLASEVNIEVPMTEIFYKELKKRIA